MQLQSQLYGTSRIWNHTDIRQAVTKKAWNVERGKFYGDRRN